MYFLFMTEYFYHEFMVPVGSDDVILFIELLSVGSTIMPCGFMKWFLWNNPIPWLQWTIWITMAIFATLMFIVQMVAGGYI